MTGGVIPDETDAADRKRKLRCDRLPVCSQCQKSKRACRYSDTENGTASDGSEAEGGGRPVKRAQRSSVAASLKPEWPAAHRNPGPASGSDVQVAAAALRPPSVSMEVSARLDRLERLLVDQGSPALSSTARQGIHHTHQTQPRTHSARVVASPLTIRSLSVKGGLRTRFVGQNNTKVLLNLVCRPAHSVLGHPVPAVSAVGRMVRMAHRLYSLTRPRTTSETCPRETG